MTQKMHVTVHIKAYSVKSQDGTDEFKGKITENFASMDSCMNNSLRDV